MNLFEKKLRICDLDIPDIAPPQVDTTHLLRFECDHNNPAMNRLLEFQVYQNLHNPGNIQFDQFDNR